MPLIQGGPPEWIWERTPEALKWEIVSSGRTDGPPVYEFRVQCGLEILRLQFFTAEEVGQLAALLGEHGPRRPDHGSVGSHSVRVRSVPVSRPFPEGDFPMAHHEHRSCIDACVECAQECEHCADACLSEPDVSRMAECIRLDRDCAEICWAAAGYMSRGSHFLNDVCRVCADVCDACAAECEKHEADHCRRCAEACHPCAEECRRMAGAGV